MKRDLTVRSLAAVLAAAALMTSARADTAPSTKPAEKISTQQVSLANGKSAACVVYEPTIMPAAEKRWLVVYLHGAGGSTKSYNLGRPPYESIRQALADAGATVIVPELGPSHFMNDEAQATLDTIIDVILKEREIAPDRVHMMGTSMGAGSSLAYAILRPGRVQSICALMPMTDFALWASEHPKYFKRLATAYGGTAAEKPQAYDDKSPMKHLDAFAKVPIFLVHGTADTVVSFNHSQSFANALKEKGYPCTFRAVADVGHADAIAASAADDIVAFYKAVAPR